ncbi:ExbD/TolR family protein [Tautonia plasticadhaerens]|uniref:Biopolymer transport protein ExbD n=1 Tax=Tautonia plasticadhaerens TaxID=2527974 RepID=A0A518H5F6_9BACT|nr:biopolymer transporter ExbD [Tautonia plasticadhaerens]QDV36062.1 Biopolymer transport protein ExbD [Tautonia plasticadhaerens]
MLGEGKQDEEMPSVTMTPMVDVMLCLLIFFMVASRLYDWDEQQFNVRVPEVGDASPLTSRPEDLTLTVVEPGLVAVGGEQYDLEALRGVLESAREAYEDQGVRIRGDASLSFQDLADVLSACDSAGIRHVSLLVRPRDEPDAGAVGGAE